ncbi:probable calcium-binding protein CML41 [Macadamia integrifolia]|uniref:probable calcium-binding protein CML41 n=1 Tax=Macadamia integrifolia TaxID=60698 RepID=UPI001C4F6AD3|nr:probable calcium-binding protein CML41 [Macadamia integrifolia]
MPRFFWLDCFSHIVIALSITAKSNKQQTRYSDFLRSSLQMATSVLSKQTLSKWFSNKSFVLSAHRLHQHSKQQSTNDEHQQIFCKLDANGNGKIEGFELRSYLASIGIDGGDDDLKRGFEMFVAKGCGSITTEGLQRMFSRLGYKISNEECKKVIQAFDLNGDGVFDYSEFQQMMA